MVLVGVSHKTQGVWKALRKRNREVLIVFEQMKLIKFCERKVSVSDPSFDV